MPKNSSSQAHPCALITGASRGLGAAYAHSLAEKGYNLLLSGREESKLAELAESLRFDLGIQVHWTTVDLSQPEASETLYDFAHRHGGIPDLLINNAGFGMYGAFHTQGLMDTRNMLHVHIHAVVEIIHRFLPYMLERRRGSIINVSSLAGFFSLPFMAEYAATKAFLISFSEALAEEIRPFGVKVQVCCPGQTNTDFHKTAGFRPKGVVSPHDPEEVVRVSLLGLERNKVTIPIGFSGHVAVLLSKWLPRRVLTRLAATRIRPSP